MKTRSFGSEQDSGPSEVGGKATSTFKRKRLWGWIQSQAEKALGKGAKAFRIEGAGVEPQFRIHVMNKMEDGQMVGGHGRTQNDALAMARKAYQAWQSAPTKTETT